MLLEMTESRILAELDNLPETDEYPPEVVERWVKEGEIALHQLAIGELTPKTAREYAAEKGIRIG